jgi:tyrosyl-tRNA synthetase
LVSQLTQGKARWNTLRDADREKILEMMATKESIPKLAMREIPYDEKISAISNYYLAEHIKDIKVSDKEIKKAYKKVKSRYKKSKAPSFDKIKESLKMEIARDIYIKRLMKQIKVKLK